MSASINNLGTNHQGFAFEAAGLQALAIERRRAYQTAEPFPHIALDDFLPGDVISEVAGAFPARDASLWYVANKKWETKQSCENEAAFPPPIRSLLREFNSSAFLEFLETLTGVEGIIPDPHFRGGGLHSIARGGKLGIHADFNFYPRLKIHRRLNLLLYLNDAWSPEYGGELELWDRKMQKCIRSYAPIRNRCVIFSTTDDSFHGHPNPLDCPEERSRNSLALYYYTAEGSMAGQSKPHSTLFQQRPGSPDEVPRNAGLVRKLLRKLNR